MTELAARIDPCVNWFKLLVRTKGRILWIFPSLLFVGYLCSVNYSAIGDFVELHSQRRANAPLLAEARGLNLDYEQVLAKPSAYVGKPVVWCLNNPEGGSAYVSGRQGWTVALDGASEEYRTYGNGSSTYCLDVLAVVDGFKDGLIQLRPVEKL